MKLDTSDLPRLQFSLIAAVLMIAIGTGAVHFSLDASRTAKRLQAAALSERNDIGARLQRIGAGENEIRNKAAILKQLQLRGLVGDEQRLEWVELLSAIRDKRQLIDLRYDMAPQRPLDPAPAGELSFFVSTMTIQLKLLHEEDLTRLLDDLRLQAKALVKVKSCNVSRLLPGGLERARLQAECQIDWITLREVPGK